MDTGSQIDDAPIEGNWQQRRLERIKEYIAENLSTNLSTAVIAAKFGIASSTLANSFQKFLPESYQRYVEKVRMKKAMDLTRQGKRIWEIMLATGYKNYSTFHKAFRRAFEHPPGRFRYDGEKECLL